MKDSPQESSLNSDLDGLYAPMNQLNQFPNSLPTIPESAEMAGSGTNTKTLETPYFTDQLPFDQNQDNGIMTF